jgi:Sulfotransferase domain
VLPNLLVIGAAKCGTTSLHEYLHLHPEVAMSREKELNFFVPEKNGGRSLEWYERQFDEGAPVRGESSPAYTAHPFYPGPPARIRTLLPDVRLVYLVRDPVERTVSHWLHRASTHHEMPSFEDALDSEQGEWIVGLSRYWLQLEQYLAHFPPEQILVVDSDDLRERRDETLARIFGFVGVDPGFRSPEFEREHLPVARPMRRTGAGHAVLDGLHRSLGPERTRTILARTPAVLKTPFRRTVERPVVSEAARARLEHELRPDVERLRAHTGEAFAGWSI